MYFFLLCLCFSSLFNLILKTSQTIFHFPCGLDVYFMVIWKCLDKTSNVINLWLSFSIEMKIFSRFFHYFFQTNISGVPCKSSGPLGVSWISQTVIMKAVLETAGPVATPQSLKSVKRSMHLVTTKQFMEAAEELEKNNFGKLIKIAMGSRGKPAVVFIKKPPSEMEILRTNTEWCTFDVYAARYKKVASKTIGLQLRAKLVSMKLVSKQCFM